jgi:tRNA(adenine34) deaminase
MLSVHKDDHFMNEALKQARIALDEGEVPVGAVIVAGNRIIARAHNQTEKLNDVTAHAEMLAVTSAFNYLGARYLPDCRLFVTLEPCLMCAGAIAWSQLGGLIYGASDPNKGYSRIKEENLLHPSTKVTSGVLKMECKALMDDFFSRIRE